jgi:hypothetical protein
MKLKSLFLNFTNFVHNFIMSPQFLQNEVIKLVVIGLIMLKIQSFENLPKKFLIFIVDIHKLLF